MIELYNADCYGKIKDISDKSVDLVIIDPPYEFDTGGPNGAFGMAARSYRQAYIDLYVEQGHTREAELNRLKSNIANSVGDNLKHISKGFDLSLLDELIRVMKSINIYIYMV